MYAKPYTCTVDNIVHMIASILFIAEASARYVEQELFHSVNPHLHAYKKKDNYYRVFLATVQATLLLASIHGSGSSR